MITCEHGHRGRFRNWRRRLACYSGELNSGGFETPQGAAGLCKTVVVLGCVAHCDTIKRTQSGARGFEGSDGQSNEHAN